MDPFSAFAAAGNVLQFIQVGVNIAGQTLDLLRNGGDSQIQDLKLLVQQILVSNDHLRQILEQNKTHNKPPGSESALQRANKSCLKISEEFLNFLSSVTTPGPVNTWKAIRSSFKNSMIREKIHDYHCKLQDARSNLILSLLLHHVSTSTTHDQYQSLVASTENRLSDLIQNLSPRPQSFQGDMADLASALENAHISDELPDAKAKVSLLASHCRELENYCVRANRNILSSLRFPEMSDRCEAIVSAHDGTYDWIFKFDKVAGTVWDNFMQWLILNDTGNIFWVRGKPGAGKSTLMRWINDQIGQQVKRQLQNPLENTDIGWSEPADLIIVSHYFWYAGSSIQKSMAGFLRSVLFQLFEADASLIWKCVPTNFWRQTVFEIEVDAIAWKQRELTDTITDALKKLKPKTKVLLIIDGLDEFDGSDDQRAEMVAMVKEWTSLSHVKACLASRPWNVYSDLFEKAPQLRLEDLTWRDMSIFTRDQLQSDLRFQRFQRAQPMTAEVLMREIVDKANGVFLWVRLVIALLLKRLRDGARFTDLITELRRMPDDLEEFFVRMTNSIDPGYRSEAVRLLRAMLFSVSMNRGHPAKSSIEDQSLLLYDTIHLFEQQNDFFCLEPGYSESLRIFEATELEQDLEYDMVVRRINSRSMGLLEVLPLVESERHTRHSYGTLLKDGVSPRFFNTRVDFIHRCVNEFLLTPAAQSFLDDSANEKPHDAYVYYYNVLVARFLAVSTISEPPFKSFSKWLVFHLQQNSRCEGQNFDLFEIVMSSDAAQMALAHDRLSLKFATQTDGFTLGQSLSFVYAHEYSWDRYIMCRLHGEHVKSAFRRPFLELTLGLWHMKGSFRLGTNFAIVKHVANLGCELLPDATQSSILLRYLSFLPHALHITTPSKEVMDILYLLITRAGRYFSVSDLETWPELRHRVGTSSNLDSATPSCDIVDVISTMRCHFGGLLFHQPDVEDLRQKLNGLPRKIGNTSPAISKAMSNGAKRKFMEDSARFSAPQKKKRHHTLDGAGRVLIDLTEEDDD